MGKLEYHEKNLSETWLTCELQDLIQEEQWMTSQLDKRMMICLPLDKPLWLEGSKPR